MTTIRLAAVTILALPLFALPAGAAGGGGTGTTEVSKCEKGYVYDTKTKKCVKAEEQSLSDDALLENAIALAYAERFDEAIAVLERIEDKQRPDVLNYLGYATRNAGNIKGGLKYYRAALALDPDYTLARSYMGQALLNVGDRRGAMVQLDEIERRCGTTCRENTLLANALVQKSLGNTVRY